ncbi:hypothetical protein SK128_010757, partial [Halocaridina rubra]
IGLFRRNSRDSGSRSSSPSRHRSCSPSRGISSPVSSPVSPRRSSPTPPSPLIRRQSHSRSSSPQLTPPQSVSPNTHRRSSSPLSSPRHGSGPSSPNRSVSPIRSQSSSPINSPYGSPLSSPKHIFTPAIGTRHSYTSPPGSPKRCASPISFSKPGSSPLSSPKKVFSAPNSPQHSSKVRSPYSPKNILKRCSMWAYSRSNSQSNKNLKANSQSQTVDNDTDSQQNKRDNTKQRLTKQYSLPAQSTDQISPTQQVQRQASLNDTSNVGSYSHGMYFHIYRQASLPEEEAEESLQIHVIPISSPQHQRYRWVTCHLSTNNQQQQQPDVPSCPYDDLFKHASLQESRHKAETSMQANENSSNSPVDTLHTSNDKKNKGLLKQSSLEYHFNTYESKKKHLSRQTSLPEKTTHASPNVLQPYPTSQLIQENAKDYSCNDKTSNNNSSLISTSQVPSQKEMPPPLQPYNAQCVPHITPDTKLEDDENGKLFISLLENVTPVNAIQALAANVNESANLRADKTMKLNEKQKNLLESPSNNPESGDTKGTSPKSVSFQPLVTPESMLEQCTCSLYNQQPSDKQRAKDSSMKHQIQLESLTKYQKLPESPVKHQNQPISSRTIYKQLEFPVQSEGMKNSPIMQSTPPSVPIRKLEKTSSSLQEDKKSEIFVMKVSPKGSPVIKQSKKAESPFTMQTPTCSPIKKYTTLESPIKHIARQDLPLKDSAEEEPKLKFTLQLEKITNSSIVQSTPPCSPIRKLTRTTSTIQEDRKSETFENQVAPIGSPVKKQVKRPESPFTKGTPPGSPIKRYSRPESPIKHKARPDSLLKGTAENELQLKFPAQSGETTNSPIAQCIPHFSPIKILTRTASTTQQDKISETFIKQVSPLGSPVKKQVKRPESPLTKGTPPGSPVKRYNIPESPIKHIARPDSLLKGTAERELQLKFLAQAGEVTNSPIVHSTPQFSSMKKFTRTASTTQQDKISETFIKQLNPIGSPVKKQVKRPESSFTKGTPPGSPIKRYNRPESPIKPTAGPDSLLTGTAEKELQLKFLVQSGEATNSPIAQSTPPFSSIKKLAKTASTTQQDKISETFIKQVSSLGSPVKKQVKRPKSPFTKGTPPGSPIKKYTKPQSPIKQITRPDSLLKDTTVKESQAQKQKQNSPLMEERVQKSSLRKDKNPESSLKQTKRSDMPLEPEKLTKSPLKQDIKSCSLTNRICKNEVLISPSSPKPNPSRDNLDQHHSHTLRQSHTNYRSITKPNAKPSSSPNPSISSHDKSANDYKTLESEIGNPSQSKTFQQYTQLDQNLEHTLLQQDASYEQHILTLVQASSPASGNLCKIPEHQGKRDICISQEKNQLQEIQTSKSKPEPLLRKVSESEIVESKPFYSSSVATGIQNSSSKTYTNLKTPPYAQKLSPTNDGSLQKNKSPSVSKQQTDLNIEVLFPSCPPQYGSLHLNTALNDNQSHQQYTEIPIHTETPVLLMLKTSTLKGNQEEPISKQPFELKQQKLDLVFQPVNKQSESESESSIKPKEGCHLEQKDKKQIPEHRATSMQSATGHLALKMSTVAKPLAPPQAAVLMDSEKQIISVTPNPIAPIQKQPRPVPPLPPSPKPLFAISHQSQLHSCAPCLLPIQSYPSPIESVIGISSNMEEIPSSAISSERTNPSPLPEYDTSSQLSKKFSEKSQESRTSSLESCHYEAVHVGPSFPSQTSCNSSTPLRLLQSNKILSKSLSRPRGQDSKIKVQPQTSQKPKESQGYPSEGAKRGHSNPLAIKEVFKTCSLKLSTITRSSPPSLPKSPKPSIRTPKTSVV